MIEGPEQLKKYITKYYKALFGAPDDGNISVNESQTNDITQISDEEIQFLTSLFSGEEVKRAIFQMEHNNKQGSWAAWLSR